jgi:hypothetical protein
MKKTLIVGHYSQQTEAKKASRELARAGFPRGEISMFYVSPQGQHATFPVGGDEDESTGTHDARSGAVRGAVGGVGAGTLLGAAAIPVIGPAGPLFGAAVGAYTGSLVGALKHLDDDDEGSQGATPAPDPDEQQRRSGVMVVVAVGTTERREDAIEILGAHAEALEEAEGELQNGDWTDFDPRTTFKPIG